MISLVAGFVLTTMLAGKIYRTGILLYGKKVTFREMGRWLFRRA
jgi:ABC-2 type transport system permease protein